jgi:hypothetical protein
MNELITTGALLVIGVAAYLIQEMLIYLFNKCKKK